MQAFRKVGYQALYSIHYFLVSMPLAEDATVAIYADDTGLIVCSERKTEAPTDAQMHLNKICIWLSK